MQELWFPNFVQGPVIGRLYPTTTQGQISGKCVFRLLPCDSEENVTGGGTEVELLVDDQGHRLYPF